MKKIPAVVLILVVVFATIFATWQMFLGNLEAAFSSLPFLLAAYLLVSFSRR